MGNEEVFINGASKIFIDVTRLKSIEDEDGFKIFWTHYCYREGQESDLAKGIRQVEGFKLGREEQKNWHFLDPKITSY